MGRLVARGWQVRALVRHASRERFQAALGVEVILGDLADPGALAQFVSGADAVVHTAAAVRGWTASFQEVNVAGTRRLARAAARVTPAPHFLLLSSLAAREPQLSPYAASKRGAEAALLEEAGDMPWTVLRPPAVYGPGDREVLPLLTWMARGIAPIPGSGKARFSLVFVEDLADCIVELAPGTHPSGATLEVHDGHAGGYGWSDVREAIAQLSGRRSLRVRIPAPLASGIGALNLLARRALGQAPMLTPGKVRELTHPDWVCDDSALRAAIAWRPAVGLAQGLRRTLDPTRVQPGVQQHP